VCVMAGGARVLQRDDFGVVEVFVVMGAFAEHGFPAHKDTANRWIGRSEGLGVSGEF